MFLDNHHYHPFSGARPSQQNHLQWQQSHPSSYVDQFTFYGGDSFPAQRHQTGGASASDRVQTIEYSTSRQGVAPSPSTISAGRSQYIGAGAATANNLAPAASGNACPNFLSTPTQPEVACTDSASDFFDPAYQAYQAPGYDTSYPDPNPPQRFPDFYGNNYDHRAIHPSVHFGTANANAHADHHATHPLPLPQLTHSESLPSDFYGLSSASFQQSQRRHNEPSLHQERRLIVANRPLDGFAPAKDNDLPPADVSPHQRLLERVTTPTCEPTRVSQSIAVSPVHARAYNRPHAFAPGIEGLDQVDCLARHPSNPTACTCPNEDEHILHGHFADASRREQHIPVGSIPGDWIPGEWIAAREPSEDHTNEVRRGHSSATVFREDCNLIMPPQSLSSARESGPSKKRSRAASSLDAVAGPSRQKRCTVSVANRAAAKVRKTSSHNPSAGWNQDDPFTIKDDEDKKIEVVDMTADDNIPDELQILPDPPSTKLSKFECIICLDSASTLTVTHCGT